MVEFTGERVIPGQVNDDLWSEHVARYAFARRYAEGKRVLDAGCGAGYGSAELAQSATASNRPRIAAGSGRIRPRDIPDPEPAFPGFLLHRHSFSPEQF